MAEQDDSEQNVKGPEITDFDHEAQPLGDGIQQLHSPDKNDPAVELMQTSYANISNIDELLNTMKPQGVEEVDLIFFLWRQDKAVEHLKDSLPNTILEHTGWDNMTEYLVSRLGFIPSFPVGLSDIDASLQLRIRYREKVREVVKDWAERGLL